MDDTPFFNELLRLLTAMKMGISCCVRFGARARCSLSGHPKTGKDNCDKDSTSENVGKSQSFTHLWGFWRGFFHWCQGPRSLRNSWRERSLNIIGHSKSDRNPALAALRFELKAFNLGSDVECLMNSLNDWPDRIVAVWTIPPCHDWLDSFVSVKSLFQSRNQDGPDVIEQQKSCTSRSWCKQRRYQNGQIGNNHLGDPKSRKLAGLSYTHTGELQTKHKINPC